MHHHETRGTALLCTDCMTCTISFTEEGQGRIRMHGIGRHNPRSEGGYRLVCTHGPCHQAQWQCPDLRWFQQTEWGGKRDHTACYWTWTTQLQSCPAQSFSQHLTRLQGSFRYLWQKTVPCWEHSSLPSDASLSRGFPWKYHWVLSAFKWSWKRPWRLGRLQRHHGRHHHLGSHRRGAGRTLECCSQMNRRKWTEAEHREVSLQAETGEILWTHHQWRMSSTWCK